MRSRFEPSPTRSELEETLRHRWDWLEDQQLTRPTSREQTLRDLEDDGQREDEIRQSYTGRYPLELLQNAHDATSDVNQSGSVEFVVTDSALLVANEGAPFDKDRVVSLTRHGSSEKRLGAKQRHTIGYKGVGFIAVFEICDRPQIICRNIAFGFDRARAKRRVTTALGTVPRSVPARYFPFQLDDDQWESDADEIARLLAGRNVTVVRLPFRRDTGPEAVLGHLRDTLAPELLLFMPAVQRIVVRSPGWQGEWRSEPGPKRGRAKVLRVIDAEGQQASWLVRRDSVPIARDEAAALRDPLWEDVRRLNVAAAIPWGRRGIPEEVDAQRLHVYFPTDDRLGRAILVHGDFYVDKGRRRIETDGAAGVISHRVAAAAADVVAELAEAEVRQGSALYRCLAETDQVDGFGNVVGAAIDARLRSARIARPASGSQPRRPPDVLRLDTGLALAVERKLAGLLVKTSDVLMPGDDAGLGGELLKRLGSGAMSPTDLASRVDARRSELGYDEVLAVLWRWVDALNEFASGSVLEQLRERFIVRDSANEWRRPEEVVLRLGDLPQLPRRLARDELLKPRGRFASALIHALEIPELTHAVALEIVLDAVEERTFGESPAQAREALRLVWELWQRNRRAVHAESARVGVLRVPTRTTGSRRAHWRRADQTYFGQAWSNSRVLENAYGPLGEPEFLSEAPPRSTAQRKARKAFFNAVGVADKPRLESLDGARSGLAEFGDWRQLPGVQAAWSCVQDHPDSIRKIDGSVMDRLDTLLKRDDARSRAAIVAALLELDEPYGPDATIRCSNQSHGGRAAQKTAVGYQRWRLEASFWVPVAGDPSGATSRRPVESWYDLPARRTLALPRARLARSTCERLELIAASRAPAEAIAASLGELAGLDASLADAGSPVIETAEWLTRRLDRALRRATEPPPVPPFPARSGGKWTWSQTPVVADLAGLEQIARLELLPPPGRWAGLRRAYDLPLASETVTYDLDHGRRRRAQPLVPTRRRAQILALLRRLGARGAELDRVAVRLARMGERPVDWLRLTVNASETAPIELSPPYHLFVRRDSLNRVIGGTLFRHADGGLPVMAIARDLSDYLGTEESAEITLLLQTPEDRLAYQDVTEDEVAEAEADIARHRRAKADDGDDVVDEQYELEDLIAPLRDDERAPEKTGRPRRPPANRETEEPRKPTESEDEPLPPLDAAGIRITDIPGDAEPAPPDTPPQGGGYAGGGGGGTPVDWEKIQREQRLYGARGEEAVFLKERERVEAAGHDPMSVQWRSKEDEFSPYDIGSLDEDGQTIYIEVKSTTGADPAAPFPISAAQLRLGMERRNRFWIYRVTNVNAAAPYIFRCQDPISAFEEQRATLRLRDATMRIVVPDAFDE